MTVDLPRLGFGAAAIANEGVGLGQALDCVDAAWDSGMRYFDTAPMYGSGHSERLLGLALRGRPRGEYVLSTKVGRLVRPSHPDTATTGAPWIYDFSREGILTSLEESLLRLGVESVDMVYIHDPDDHWREALDEAWPTVARLRDEGVVRAVGVGMVQAPMLARFIRETDIDLVLAAGVYTLLDTQAIDDLLPEAERRGVTVVAAQSLHGGLIDGVAEPMFRYRPVDEQTRAKTARIAKVCHEFGLPTAAVALQFPRGHPSVGCVLTGPASREQLTENLAWAAQPIPPEVWARLREEGLLPPEVPVPSR
ncbi:aldo/keto reductase [Catenulispora acidiphila DSM 44928]|uniref:Aldo/keto reductase n=1 Tax=Catenulispora acidiphila (strain DSM 44928 / JCM 14897 / NBRC 102108 / NRRL B-24433 / ID139908) TaxID=479433 RepID=C7Q508_CATAD|nr:aldo/keto reductase [Catenulispora acidiphila]ACU73956.1 aldo/keto reductase [Catenulispora acidiphila DSM 44928]